MVFSKLWESTRHKEFMTKLGLYKEGKTYDYKGVMSLDLLFFLLIIQK